MRLTLGYAKNETLELMVGNIFMISGGAIISYFLWAGILIISIGICFDIRVLLKFNKDLSDTKNSIHQAKLKLNQAESKIELTIKEMNEQEKKLEDVRKKSFSYISRVGMDSLEDLMRDSQEKFGKEFVKLEKEIKEIKNFLNKQFGHRFW